ncbi:MAG TPA: hypothetical protein VEI03_20660 [Stellaceae bacterium]|nr:hypothetical protein [Stellaceae bacterium]
MLGVQFFNMMEVSFRARAREEASARSAAPESVNTSRSRRAFHQKIEPCGPGEGLPLMGEC